MWAAEGLFVLFSILYRKEKKRRKKIDMMETIVFGQ
jgi:hypothetical protein